jgi:WD40 repeat protein
MEVKSDAPIVTSIDYSPDAKFFATGGLDGLLRIWDIEAGILFKQIKVAAAGQLMEVKYFPDGKTIVTGNLEGALNKGEGFVRFWDIQTGAQTKQLSGYGGVMGSAKHITLSSDGKYLLFKNQSNAFSLVDNQTGRGIREFSGDEGSISPDARYVFAWDIHQGLFISFSTKLVELNTGKELWSIPVDDWPHNRFRAFSPDSKRLLVLSSDNSKAAARLIEVATGNEIGHFEVPSPFMTGASFSPDGKTFISSFRAGSGIIGDRMDFITRDSQTGEMLRQFSMSDLESTLSNPISPTFSPSNKFVIAAAGSSLKLLDTSTGEELATFIGFADGEWLIVTPNGYYNSSEKGDQYLSVTVGGKQYTISQLRESFYRPDLVKVALAGQKVEGMKKMADIKPSPSVAIINTPASVTSGQVTVSLEVKDQGGGIGDVRLYLNGTAVVLDQSGRALRLKSESPNSARTFSYPLQLISGKNSLRAVAFNADNSMQSTDAWFEIDANTTVKKPALHALVVGIQEYENPKLSLKYPVADANLFADTLKEHAAGLFNTISVTSLTTRQETTSASITAALHKMRTQVGPNDLFVFYVASHGTVDDGEYFLITSNVGATSTEKLKRDALSQNSLKELISNIPAAKKLIVLDTCNAGMLGDAIQVAMLTRGMSEDTAFKILSRAVGSTILSAANSQQEALEGYRDHGLFTYVLSEGLQGKADMDKDGFVKTTELASYIEDEVPALAEKIFKRKQYPVASPSGQGFPVSRVK